MRHLIEHFSEKFSVSRNTAKVLKVLIMLMVFLGCILYGIKNVDDMNGPEPGQPRSVRDYNDFNVFFGAGQGILKGQDIYFAPTSPEGRYFLYPPAFGLYMSMVAKLNLRGAAIYWYVAQLLMVVSSAFLIASILVQSRSARIVLAVLGMFLVARFIDSDFGNGNANAHVLFFLSLGLWCLARKHSFLGGFAFGIASIIKITPIIFLGYFAWKFLMTCLSKKVKENIFSRPALLKYWGRSMAGMVAALILFTAVLPPLMLGWQRNFDLHRDFYISMVHPFTKISNHPEKFWDAGSSMKALLLRYLTERSQKDPTKKMIQVNIANWSRDAVWRLYAINAMIIIGLSIFSWKDNLTTQEHTRSFPFLLSLELGAVAAIMILISPVSRKAHFIVLLIPVVAALGTSLNFAEPKDKNLKRLLIFGAAIVGLVGIGSSVDILGKRLFLIAHAHTVLFWAAFFIWLSCTLALLLINRKESPGWIDQPKPIEKA